MKLKSVVTDSLGMHKLRLRPWREVALIMLMVMEVSWVVPWFRSLTPATNAAKILDTFLILFGMMLSAHVIVRFLDFMRLKILIRQIVMILLLIISILLGLKLLLYSGEIITFLELLNRPMRSFADWKTVLPDEFIIAIAVIIGWWRGISLAHDHIGPHLVMNHFNFGIVMFFIYGFVNTMVTGETPGILIFVFIFASLLAMGSSRMSILHTLRGGGLPEFDRRWFIGMTFASFIVVFITGVTTSFFQGGTGFIGYLVAGIFYIFTLLTYILFSPIILVLLWIFGNLPINLTFLDTIVDSLRNLQSMFQQALSRFNALLNQSGVPEVLANWGPGMKALFFVVLIVLAIFGVALWIGIRVWRERERKVIADDQSSLIKPGELWKLIRSILQNRTKELWANISDFNFLTRNRQLRAAERIRQIYIEMMVMCTNLNIPRPEAATPIEFMPTIKNIFPDNMRDIETITIAYTRIRYGELPEQQRDVISVEEAWERVSGEGQSILGSRKGNKKSPDITPGDF